MATTEEEPRVTKQLSETLRVDALFRLVGFKRGLRGALPYVVQHYVETKVEVDNLNDDEETVLATQTIKHVLDAVGMSYGACGKDFETYMCIVGSEINYDLPMFDRYQQMAAMIKHATEDEKFSANQVLVALAVGAKHPFLEPHHAHAVLQTIIAGKDMEATKTTGAYMAQYRKDAAQAGMMLTFPGGVRAKDVATRLLHAFGTRGPLTARLYSACHTLGFIPKVAMQCALHYQRMQEAGTEYDVDSPKH